MDPKNAQINIKNNLGDENHDNTNKDMSAELANLNKVKTDQKDLPVIKLKEHDIELLKKELDITNDEAKKKLIKFNGDVEKVIDDFLNDFHLN